MQHVSTYNSHLNKGRPTWWHLLYYVNLLLNMFQMLIHLKHISNQSLLLPYEQYHFQALHHNRKLIPEQSPADTNPLFLAVINP